MHRNGYGHVSQQVERRLAAGEKSSQGEGLGMKSVFFFMGPFRTQSLGFRVWFHGLGLGICSSGVAVEDLEIGLRCAVSSAHVFIYSGTKLGA